MRAFYQPLPHSCLLTLQEGDGSGHPLVEVLRQTLHNGQRSVWVDCRHISALPNEALLLLSRYAARLWRRGGHLILCHLPARERVSLVPNPTEPLASCLLDADLYGLPCPESPAC